MVECDQDETLFKYGDSGDLFYIIIEGEVSIKTPTPVVLEGDDITPVGLVCYFLTNYGDMHWVELTDGDKVRQLLLRELELLGVKVGSWHDAKFNAKDAIERTLKAIGNGKSHIQDIIFKRMEKAIDSSS